MARGPRGTLLGIPASAVVVIGGIWLLPIDLALRAFGALVAAIAALLALVLARTPLGVLRASPSHGLGFLARRLRAAGVQVREDPGKLVARIGPVLYLEIDAVAMGEGIRVRYRADLDPVGWTGYGILMGLVALLPFGIPLLLMGVRLVTFHERVLAGILPPTGEVPAPPGIEAVREMLIDNLSECHRLAAEAYEAARSAYWDLQGIAILTGVLAFGLLLLVSLFVVPDPDVFLRLSNALPVAAAGGLASGGAFAHLVRRRLRPRIRSYREWRGRLRIALDAELADSESAGAVESQFETIVAAAREVPGWIEARRSAGLSADLGMWSLFWIVLGWAVQLSVVGAYRIGTDPLAGLAAIVASMPFVGVLYLWWRWWARRQREASQRHTAAWTARFEQLRAKMDMYLQDL